jgi:hypothetical protein
LDGLTGSRVLDQVTGVPVLVDGPEGAGDSVCCQQSNCQLYNCSDGSPTPYYFNPYGAGIVCGQGGAPDGCWNTSIGCNLANGMFTLPPDPLLRCLYAGPNVNASTPARSLTYYQQSNCSSNLCNYFQLYNCSDGSKTPYYMSRGVSTIGQIVVDHTLGLNYCFTVGPYVDGTILNTTGAGGASNCSDHNVCWCPNVANLITLGVLSGTYMVSFGTVTSPACYCPTNSLTGNNFTLTYAANIGTAMTAALGNAPSGIPGGGGWWFGRCSPNSAFPCLNGNNIDWITLTCDGSCGWLINCYNYCTNIFYESISNAISPSQTSNDPRQSYYCNGSGDPACSGGGGTWSPGLGLGSCTQAPAITVS